MTLQYVSSDRPTAHDSLGRGRFVERLADQVRFLPAGDSGYVLGLTGAWGSGKSQVIELLKEQLAGDGGIVVLELNPWYFSGVEDLVGYVFDELRGQLSEAVSAGEIVQEASGTVRRVAAGLGALASLTKMGVRAFSYLGPGPGVLADAAAGVLDVASKATKAAAHVAEGATALEATAPVAESPSLRKTRSELRQALGAAPFRLLVIIDDLDRLEDDEIRTMMRVVRLMADLPNVVHLVAFDRPRVERVLATEGGDADLSGQRYLEKIFQLLVDVPVPTRGAIDRMLRARLELVLGPERWAALCGQRLEEVLADGLLPMMATPRDVVRYTNALPLALHTLGDEIDGIDLIAMEAIRTFLPDAFRALPWLVSQQPGFWRSRGEGVASNLLTMNQARTSGISPERMDGAKGLFRVLFPVVSERAPATEPTVPPRRVSSRDGFFSYFQHVAPEDVLTASEAAQVARLVRSAYFDARFADLTRAQFLQFLQALPEVALELPEDWETKLVAPVIKRLWGEGHIQAEPQTNEPPIAAFLAETVRRLANGGRQSKLDEIVKALGSEYLACMFLDTLAVHKDELPWAVVLSSFVVEGWFEARLGQGAALQRDPFFWRIVERCPEVLEFLVGDGASRESVIELTLDLLQKTKAGPVQNQRLAMFTARVGRRTMLGDLSGRPRPGGAPYFPDAIAFIESLPEPEPPLPL